jgi:hypothetical protein
MNETRIHTDKKYYHNVNQFFENVAKFKSPHYQQLLAKFYSNYTNTILSRYFDNKPIVHLDKMTICQYPPDYDRMGR